MKVVLDSHNIVIELDESWNDNLIVSSRSLIDSEIVGKSLFSFISGDITQMAVNSALSYTRIVNSPLKKNYRCDGPDVKRFCGMELILLNNGIVKMEHSLLRLDDYKLSSLRAVLTYLILGCKS